MTSIFPIAYGCSKFLSGVLGARTSPSLLLAGGLMATAVMNVMFGFGTSLAWFCTFWALNGVLQVRGVCGGGGWGGHLLGARVQAIARPTHPPDRSAHCTPPPPVSGVLTSGESKLDSSILWQWEKALVFLRALEARVPLVFERGREKPLSQALSSSLTPQCFLSVFSSLFFSPIFSLRARARETTLPPLSLLQPSEAKVSMYREWQKRIGRAEGCFIRCQFSGVFFFFF